METPNEFSGCRVASPELDFAQYFLKVVLVINVLESTHYITYIFCGWGEQRRAPCKILSLKQLFGPILFYGDHKTVTKLR